MAKTHTRADHEGRGPLTRHLFGLMALCAFGATTNAACLFDGDDDREPLLPAPECETDAECAHLNTDDPCFGDAFCNGGSCQIDFLQDDDACQCDHPLHCRNLGFEELGCNVVSCSDDHRCSEEIVAAGPSPEERDGDCVDLVCDGESKEPVVTMNLDDVDDDGNACTVDTCTDEGPDNDPVPDGSICGDGICYEASCFAGCVPANPDACGDEGPNEPANDDGFAATAVSENETSCGMLDGEDTDWFEMYLVDEDFETDIIGFEVMSSASSIELCAFVVCEDGSTPAGGCADRQVGPVGSEGCCWAGDPTSLSPTWDLDCTGSDDDSGTMFFSVRAPNGGACETYRISAHY